MITWRKEQWARHVSGPLLDESLDCIQSDDGCAPTLEKAVREARYILSLYFESGTLAGEELSGECGIDAKKRAQSEVRKCKAFIKKYSVEE